jgi:hypothetical protein
MYTFQMTRVFILRVGVCRPLNVVFRKRVLWVRLFVHIITSGRRVCSAPASGSAEALVQWFSCSESVRAPFLNGRHSLCVDR